LHLSAAAVIVLTSWVPFKARAQEQPLRPGTPVRLTVPCDRPTRPADDQGSRCRVRGEWLGSRADTVSLTVAGSTTAFDLDAVSRLEVSRGRRSHWLVGAGVGFVAGAGATYLVLNSGGSTALCDRSANQDAISSGECLGLTAAGGLAGAGLGALVGMLFRSDRWEEFPLARTMARSSSTPNAFPCETGASPPLNEAPCSSR
jgi:hypothetical protein